MKKRNGVAIEKRQENILGIIRKNGKASVKDLCDTFEVSVVTVRNDLILLEDKGLIIRTHGGAIAVKENEEGLVLPFDIREEKHFENKQRIGKAAADLVNDGEVIFIDGGTTASEMRHYLVDKKDITIITPSIVVTYWLAVTSNLKIYVLNGFFERDSYSTVGVPSMDFMSQWNLSKAFFGAAGFTLNEGLSDLEIGFVEQKKIIAEKAHTNIGLVDSSKWGILSLGSFVAPGDIDMLITDTDTPADEIQKARDLGIVVESV
ncbi:MULTISPECIES: DeoR/GlpR family DNA-binding transcription regulator [unclassified Oceanispirochaeta]|uniref:DeoR/GlpR family DNA-binding transcription regulator n=1 Tax=unclassified Oceanispirochaeta TaxID=2635722 RepID=UPI000E09120A|nr:MULTISPECIES: DeoR/GlpR family DNA-binding transcription regulator [unclassified Oceanispirochaeta]MBF9016680.1 DeoR/GlpR transcriptional regulator [Oceanispirochaeta sp. M2]NPD73115.1 DeoR/GlpR transcriptional regulator [Oceanispirochaeta sp. M1]RDG31216.1 DeoR/GlpR transcriptional regulator [Oceanispirochaeta sp. M1]